jgi:hypothetical protein
MIPIFFSFLFFFSFFLPLFFFRFSFILFVYFPVLPLAHSQISPYPNSLAGVPQSKLQTRYQTMMNATGGADRLNQVTIEGMKSRSVMFPFLSCCFVLFWFALCRFVLCVSCCMVVFLFPRSHMKVTLLVACSL